MLGLSLSNEGRLSEAESVFRECLAARPNDTPSRFYLAMTLQKQGKQAEAEEEWKYLLRYAKRKGNVRLQRLIVGEMKKKSP
jgi:cytochrome c-type biogenesis protein CcmH/NrfG